MPSFAKDLVALEAALEALRVRNGELVTELAKHDPEHPYLAKPLGATRANRINAVLDAALLCAYGDLTVEELRESCEAYQGYWRDELLERNERARRTRKAWSERAKAAV